MSRYIVRKDINRIRFREKNDIIRINGDNNNNEDHNSEAIYRMYRYGI